MQEDKTQKNIIENKKRLGVFIDGSNLFYAEKKAGWKIDYKKLREFISQEFEISLFNFYTALPKEGDEPARKNKLKYIKHIEKLARVIIKPLKYIWERQVIDNGRYIIEGFKRKGDCDVDITVDILNNIQHLDIVIIVSGDSDFVALRDDIVKKGKKVLFIAHKDNLSIELKQGKYVTFQKIRQFVELNNKSNVGKTTTPAIMQGNISKVSVASLLGLSSGGVNSKNKEKN